jgi:hypothetical protein
MAIKRCTPERGNLLRNIAKKINMAVEACAPESDNLLLKLANDINMTIEASLPERDDLLRRLPNVINTAIGANSSSERYNLLRNLANDIELAINSEAGAHASEKSRTNQEGTKSPDERYCDVTGETMDLGLAGTTFSFHRVFSSPAYDVKTSGSMRGINVFAASGGT